MEDEGLRNKGCHDNGCNQIIINYSSSLRDESGIKAPQSGFFTRGFCVDFKYWKKKTKHGHLIVTKGTMWEGKIKTWHERKQKELAQQKKDDAEWQKQREEMLRQARAAEGGE